jgi:hypothetical protein
MVSAPQTFPTVACAHLSGSLDSQKMGIPRFGALLSLGSVLILVPGDKCTMMIFEYVKMLIIAIPNQRSQIPFLPFPGPCSSRQLQKNVAHNFC